MVGEECEVFSVGKENENPGITTHDPMMGVTNWRLEEEELEVVCSITNLSLQLITIHCIAHLLYNTKV